MKTQDFNSERFSEIGTAPRKAPRREVTHGEDEGIAPGRHGPQSRLA